MEDGGGIVIATAPQAKGLFKNKLHNGISHPHVICLQYKVPACSLDESMTKG